MVRPSLNSACLTFLFKNSKVKLTICKPNIYETLEIKQGKRMSFTKKYISILT